MRLTRNPVTGAWQASAMQGNRLVTQTYYGYTKKEAEQEFRAHLKATK